MEGKFYIDSLDAYSEYGVFVTHGGYKELVRYASLKKVDSIDWPEEDGAQFDLQSPKLASRELSITFALVGQSYNLDGFIKHLTKGSSYHTFDFRTLSRSYKLRLTSMPDLSLARKMALLTLNFADDFPLSQYTYVAPQCSIIPTQGYALDGVDVSKYGVRILEGSFAQIEKLPNVKNNLLIDTCLKHGVVYDGEIVKFQTKDVKLSCLMRATTLEEFWHNYNALLFDLVRPGERSLYVDNNRCEYPCYYKSCNVSEFYPIGKIWFKFDLTLVFNSFSGQDGEYLLASEGGECIMTQDGEFVIDLSKLIN